MHERCVELFAKNISVFVGTRGWGVIISSITILIMTIAVTMCC